MPHLRHWLAGTAFVVIALSHTAALAQADAGGPISTPDAAQPAEAPATPDAAQPAEAQTARTTPADPALAAKAKAAAEGLSPQVQDVQIVGPWSDGTVEGVWRTVMVQSQTDDSAFHFFVQQLEGAGSDLSVRATTEVAEINQIDGTVVGYRADEPSEEQPNSLTLFFDILPSDGEIAETYELHFFPGEPYSFGPATN
ncbi:MAG TPA: hypothetical protein VIN77_12735 [Aurantimonas sp.]|uniref:DNA topoisomerase IV subunit B n=1 Tax=Aurantimonas marianensis TaxID=2920428 RepID=A0A9X2H7A3_9HYPH|nr:hypothetical protein [Aurantimonas marianensis]MCP3055536.1 hypothetical protein [Aurantimonas marianensis]